MADELNTPTHRWYQPRNHIKLPPNAVSAKYILANGVALIDAWINSQPWGVPLYLFAANEPGWLFDNSDMSTMFQDSAGTTPVTAVGQPVGKQLDKSGRNNHRTQSTAASRPTFARLPVTGRRNLLTYTEQFDNAAWTVSAASLTVAPNAALAPDGSATADKIIVANGATVNSTATYFYQLVSKSAASNTYTATIYAKAAEYNSVRVRVNDNAASANGAVAAWSLVDGTLIEAAVAGGTFTSASAGTATSVGNGWYRCSLTFTTATETVLRVRIHPRDTIAVTGDGVRGVLMWGAQLEQSAAATNYQAVSSIYDITEAGVQTAYGLYYDGVDDFMVTPTITPGTDKVQVFAGVRKLSDAAQGEIVELSASAVANNGTFDLFSSTPANTYSFRSRGTAAPSATSPAAYTSPISNVLTGIGDISGDRVTLRVNGTQVAQSVVDQGTGNYLAYPVYFGRRGGVTLPFNGYVFREIGRFGPNLDAATIANVENWVNQATGAY